jgi:hypothetical protein
VHGRRALGGHRRSRRHLAAAVAGVARDSDEWRQVVPALTAGRLNGHPDWTTAVVLRLTPVA